MINDDSNVLFLNYQNCGNQITSNLICIEINLTLTINVCCMLEHS